MERVAVAWGVETLGDLGPRLDETITFVVVRDGSRSARLYLRAALEAAEPDEMLDTISGGREVQFIESSTPMDLLPVQRPLVVRDGDIILGLLSERAASAQEMARRVRRWARPGGGADARMAAMDAIREARTTFREKGLALVLDVQSSPVRGDGVLVRDLIECLLGQALEILGDGRGGGTGVYVRLNSLRDGEILRDGGIRIEVQDSNNKMRFREADGLLSDDPTDDPKVIALRKLRNRVEEMEGLMSVVESRYGTCFQVDLPGPPLTLVR
jgi:hypothetical protein